MVSLNLGGKPGAGTVFRLTPRGQLTTLVSFNAQINGYNPSTPLVMGEDGNFYGTTTGGGQSDGNGFGSIFRVTVDNQLTPLTTFKGLNQGANREAYPSRLIQGRDGNFYGVTLMGTFFRLTPNGQRTAIATFDWDLFPNSLIQGSDGNFYGTAVGREEPIPGAVFRITPEGQITTLIRFTGENGEFPRSVMQASDGTFYGTTGQDGTSDRGTVFRLTID